LPASSFLSKRHRSGRTTSHCPPLPAPTAPPTPDARSTCSGAVRFAARRSEHPTPAPPFSWTDGPLSRCLGALRFSYQTAYPDVERRVKRRERAGCHESSQGKETTMLRQLRTWMMVGTLTAAAVGAASAQQLFAPGSAVAAYSGVVTPFGFRPGFVPHVWYQPQVLVDYQAPPQVVYVPVAVAAPRPAVEPIRTVTVLLRSSAPPADVRVRPGTVVTWTNPEDRSRTFVLEPAGVSGSSAGTGQRSGALGANASVSLAFNRAGTYFYYLQDKPDERARILVQE